MLKGLSRRAHHERFGSSKLGLAGGWNDHYIGSGAGARGR
jgi:hypothetical protein